MQKRGLVIFSLLFVSILIISGCQETIGVKTNPTTLNCSSYTGNLYARAACTQDPNCKWINDICVEKNSAYESDTLVYTSDFFDDCKNKRCSILIVVDDKLKQPLKSELDQFERDIENDLGYDAYVEYAPSYLRQYDKLSYLREFIKYNIIKSYYNTHNLKGVIFIGDIPSAQYTDSSLTEEKRKYFYSRNMPSDFYYQDVEEKCKSMGKVGDYCYEDSSGEILTCWTDDIYDLSSSDNQCKFKGDTPKPFWIARITPPKNLDQIEALKKYFTKNHAYRTKNLNENFKAMIYAPIEENDELRQRIYAEEINGLKLNGVISQSSQVDLIEDTVGDYIRATETPYQFAFVNAHGSPVWIQPGITPDMVVESNPLIYTFTSCSVGDFRDPNYIAGYHLFSGDTLFVEACSIVHWDGSNLGTQYLKALTLGLPIFEAQKLDYRDNACYAWLGDPTVRIVPKIPTKTNGPKIGVDLKDIDFGTIDSTPKTRLSKTIKLFNQGNEPLIVYFIETMISKAENENYVVSARQGERSFSESVIQPKKSLDVDLTIRPIASSEQVVLAPTELKGSIFILSNDPSNPLLKIDYKANIKDPSVFS